MKLYDGFFPMCIGCSRKEKREGLRVGDYYCNVAKAFLPSGVVSYDTDATDCVKKGLYVNDIQNSK